MGRRSDSVRSAILAGGTASRFDGAPKGLELVGGERILDRLIQALRTATGEPPLLIANAPEAGEWHPDLEVVGDAIRNCGSLGGLYTALTVVDGPVIVAAWDMPFVPIEVVEALIERFDGHDVCIPESDEQNHRLEPLCAVYGPKCVDPVRKQIVDEDLRMTRFLKSVDLITLPFEEVSKYGDPATIFFNVNTPDDLTKAQELWRSQHG
jgi:molybdopterin-guanine dinucleotide biosynthesis protein A